MIQRLLDWLRGCQHDWKPTGLQYMDRDTGIVISLRQCSLCNETIIIEV